MKQIYLLLLSATFSTFSFAQLNTKAYADEVCKILTQNTEANNNTANLQENLKVAISQILDQNSEEIAAQMLLNPKTIKNHAAATEFGKEIGKEITLELMYNCPLYQKVVLNGGREVPTFSTLVVKLGNEIEAKAKAKSGKKILNGAQAEKIMTSTIKANINDIVGAENSENFVPDLILYLLTNTKYFSRAQVNEWLKN